MKQTISTSLFNKIEQMLTKMLKLFGGALSLDLKMFSFVVKFADRPFAVFSIACCRVILLNK